VYSPRVLLDAREGPGDDARVDGGDDLRWSEFSGEQRDGARTSLRPGSTEMAEIEPCAYFEPGKASQKARTRTRARVCASRMTTL
jgi:hypothetical protein